MFKRSISKWEMVLLFINGVIGAGIFGLPSKVFKEIGVYSLLALIVCAFTVFIIIFCLAEVSSRFDKTGGPYLYARTSFGPLTGFITGWLLLLTRFITYAALINLLVTYLSFFTDWFILPIPRIITITGITIFLSYINHVGVRNSTHLNNFLTITKLLPLLLFIGVGLFFIVPENFEIKNTPNFSDFSSTVLLLVFVFGGFESILVNSGEVKDPKKNLPFALLLASLIIVIIYILIQIVCIGTLPELASSNKPLAEAAGLFMGKTGATIIAFGALFSILGTLNAIMLVGTRLPYAFSEEQQFPKAFSFIHKKYRTPTLSLILFSVVTLIVSITNSFIYAATISAITRVMIYGIVCLSLIELRKKDTGQSDYFKIPFGNVVAIAGFGVALWLLSNSKISELRDVAIAVSVGLLIYTIVSFQNKNKIN